MNPAVSILVPVYNVSNYIERCVRSLFEQTFEDIEYVFVDDASPDNSIDILNKILLDYPNRINQVKIISHDKNKGLAVARNTALDNCTGNYIVVVDSDDYIETDMVYELYNTAIQNKADIVVFDMQVEGKNNQPVELISNNYNISKNELFEKIITNDYCHSLCILFVIRELYLKQECRVPLGLNFFEDYHVAVRLIYFATTIHKINKVFYHYSFLNESSITKGVSEMHFKNTIDFWKHLDRFLVSESLFDNYKNKLDITKITQKIHLIFESENRIVRRNFFDMFSEQELRCEKHFKKGERFSLWLLRHKCFFIFELYLFLVKYKNKKK